MNRMNNNLNNRNNMNGLNAFSVNISYNNNKFSIDNNNNNPNFNRNNNVNNNNINQFVQNNQQQGNNINNPGMNNGKQDSNDSIDDDNDTQNQQDDNEFVLYFRVNDNKEIFINIDPSLSFNQIVIELKKKYEWLEGMNIKGIQYNNKNINFGQNCLQIGLQRGSKLNILFN